MGPLIRKFRVNRNLTQEQLAAKIQLLGLDLDRTDIGKIESCIRSLYDYEMIVIATALKISLSDLNLAEEDFRPLLPRLSPIKNPEP